MSHEVTVPAIWQRARIFALLCLWGIGLGGLAYAQGLWESRLGSDAQRQVVADLNRELADRYVFPDVAQKVEGALRADLRRGVFDAPRTGEALADALTQRLRELTDDKHLSVRYSAAPNMASSQTELTPDLAAAQVEARRARMQARNFSIVRIERLEHNIGYIDVRGFEPADEAADAIAAAMRLVAFTDALIIDLRENDGGYPSGVAQLSTYFFDKRTHLNDMYIRKDGRIEETWTFDHVAGPRYGGTRPVYLLVSRRTFSGGEDMAYTLQKLRRATIVGEATGGGANPGSDVRLSDNFSVFIPFARPTNPITKDNWEGKGVEPDVTSPAEGALNAARILALRRFLEVEKDPAKIRDFQMSIARLERAH